MTDDQRNLRAQENDRAEAQSLSLSMVYLTLPRVAWLPLYRALKREHGNRAARRGDSSSHACFTSFSRRVLRLASTARCCSTKRPRSLQAASSRCRLSPPPDTSVNEGRCPGLKEFMSGCSSYSSKGKSKNGRRRCSSGSCRRASRLLHGDASAAAQVDLPTTSFVRGHLPPLTRSAPPVDSG